MGARGRGVGKYGNKVRDMWHAKSDNKKFERLPVLACEQWPQRSMNSTTISYVLEKYMDIRVRGHHFYDLYWIYPEFSSVILYARSHNLRRSMPFFRRVSTIWHWRSIKPAWKLDRREKIMKKGAPLKDVVDIAIGEGSWSSEVCVLLFLFWLYFHCCFVDQSPCPLRCGRILGVVWQDGIRNPHFMPMPSPRLLVVREESIRMFPSHFLIF